MSRNRFNEIVRNVNFCDNEVRATTTNKKRNVRKMVQVLQKTFLRAWTMAARFSFDEGVLPSSSRRNPTRTFMPDKPHQGRTEMFMACDADSTYYYRYVSLRSTRCLGIYNISRNLRDVV